MLGNANEKISVNYYIKKYACYSLCFKLIWCDDISLWNDLISVDW